METYSKNSSNEEQIIRHLELVNDNFIPPLAERVNLKDYASKLVQKAERFEAWADGKLIGLVACYFNDENNGFITNVSVLEKYSGKGIAAKLTNLCIMEAKKNAYKTICLEVNKSNFKAVNLYTKFGFKEREDHNRTLKMELIL